MLIFPQSQNSKRSCMHRCLNHRNDVDRLTLDLNSRRKQQISLLQSQRQTQQHSTDRSQHAYAYCMHDCYMISRSACYIQHQLALFMYKPREHVKVRSAIHVRESNIQFLKYSDTCISVTLHSYLPIFKSQKGSIEAQNFLIIIITPQISSQVLL